MGQQNLNQLFHELDFIAISVKIPISNQWPTEESSLLNFSQGAAQAPNITFLTEGWPNMVSGALDVMVVQVPLPASPKCALPKSEITAANGRRLHKNV